MTPPAPQPDEEAEEEAPAMDEEAAEPVDDPAVEPEVAAADNDGVSGDYASEVEVADASSQVMHTKHRITAEETAWISTKVCKYIKRFKHGPTGSAFFKDVLAEGKRIKKLADDCTIFQVTKAAKAASHDCRYKLWSKYLAKGGSVAALRRSRRRTHQASHI